MALCLHGLHAMQTTSTTGADPVPPLLPLLAYERMPGDASRPLPAHYRRHEPEKTVLYNAVAGYLETFLEEAAPN